MAPAFGAYARSLLSHAFSTSLEARNPDESHDGVSSLGPLAARSLLLARDDAPARPDPESGIIHPQDFNNKFLFVLFGLLGAAFIIVGIWFFFWARNGGFYFKEDDWDDYKSTVLRRKGPNGTTLSGATTATDLGGGSVYKDIDDGSTEDATTVVSATTGITGITGGVSDYAGREKRRKKREQKERDRERRREEKRREKEELKRSKERKRARKIAEEGGVIDEDAEAEAEQYLRNYRHEKPARVGGINKESDSSQWDGSTNPTESSRGGYTESTVTSELMNDHDRTPEKPKKSSGIRKVYSTADKRDSRETERIRAEAKKLQERGRAAASSAAGASSSHRRNFSWQQNNRVDEGTPMAPSTYGGSDEVETRIPGSWTESEVGSEVGTKSYRHVIPGLSDSGAGSSVGGTDVRDYAEEKRKRRGGAGYRRER
ncbi:endosomal spry domain [Diaporthe amygdali]|uniref:endosomal spry domain n=1 Tax=Phomopsis amygdali TaxID=1214568 RepID=UPI0022FE67B2|nr:endosomal spry domain [Diaporthe amygdali]KAJ0117759.1 endosomal spry domain [Diaporthe amygdali]